MTTLLRIASKVEAAVQAYNTVKDFAEKNVWRHMFKGEMRAAIREFQRVSAENGGVFPPLHPTLATLSIVLTEDEDLGSVNRTHPKLVEHEFYDASAEFPEDLSNLLPPSAEHWWEGLAEEARRVHAQALPKAPPPLQRKVRLLVSTPPVEPEEDQDVQMTADDEPEDSGSRGRSRVTRGSTATRKRKGSSVGPTGASKRRAQPRQRSGAAERGPDGSGNKPTFTCDRCQKKGKVCINAPTGPCTLCKSMKQRCSLMPHNPSTGKTDRHLWTEEEILDFRLEQLEKSRREIKKGKKRAVDPPIAGQPEGSAMVPSPLASLSALGALTLESGGSSGNTPLDSPTTIPQPPFPEYSAPVPTATTATTSPLPTPELPVPTLTASAAPPNTTTTTPQPASSDSLALAPTPSLTTHRKSASKSPAAAHQDPPSSALPTHAHLRESRPRDNTSTASDDGNYAARIAALEFRAHNMVTWAREFDRRLEALEKRSSF